MKNQKSEFYIPNAVIKNRKMEMQILAFVGVSLISVTVGIVGAGIFSILFPFLAMVLVFKIDEAYFAIWWVALAVVLGSMLGWVSVMVSIGDFDIWQIVLGSITFVTFFYIVVWFKKRRQVIPQSK